MEYLYRAVDRDDAAVGSLLAARRNLVGARGFLEHAVGLHGLPGRITIDKSGANTAAIHTVQEESGESIELRQVKYLNDTVEQDHQTIKRFIRPVLGFHSFRCAYSAGRY